MEDKKAFTSEEAAKIICAALSSGAIQLPLNKKVQELDLAQFVNLCAGHDVTSDCTPDVVLNKAIIHAHGTKLAALARADALYLLALRESLMEGLSAHEAHQIAFAW